MQIKRAQEILDSTENIPVTYRNRQIWIENVSRTESSAHITILDTNQALDVPVSELFES